jgi:hypothetical protein
MAATLAPPRFPTRLPRTSSFSPLLPLPTHLFSCCTGRQPGAELPHKRRRGRGPPPARRGRRGPRRAAAAGPDRLVRQAASKLSCLSMPRVVEALPGAGREWPVAPALARCAQTAARFPPWLNPHSRPCVESHGASRAAAAAGAAGSSSPSRPLPGRGGTDLTQQRVDLGCMPVGAVFGRGERRPPLQ